MDHKDLFDTIIGSMMKEETAEPAESKTENDVSESISVDVTTLNGDLRSVKIVKSEHPGVLLKVLENLKGLRDMEQCLMCAPIMKEELPDFAKKSMEDARATVYSYMSSLGLFPDYSKMGNVPESVETLLLIADAINVTLEIKSALEVKGLTENIDTLQRLMHVNTETSVSEEHALQMMELLQQQLENKENDPLAADILGNALARELCSGKELTNIVDPDPSNVSKIMKQISEWLHAHLTDDEIEFATVFDSDSEDEDVQNQFAEINKKLGEQGFGEFLKSLIHS